MNLRRSSRRSLLISLTPLVDVMLILLIFFMVTSNYLNLNMMPILRKTAAADTNQVKPSTVAKNYLSVSSRAVLIRLAADGRLHIAGRSLAYSDFVAVLSSRLTTNPQTPILVLPSGTASTQDLVRLLDAISAAGGQDVRIVRLSDPP